MEPSPYLIRLSRIARWRLPPKEAADVISDYSEIMAIDPRLYEDQCKDYGTPKQAVKQLTTFADYGRWMAVFLVLAACLAAPAAWLLLQFPHFQFELPREALFLPLLLGVILSLVWFRYEGERSRELPIGLVPQLLLLLALGVCVMFLAGICFSPALLELSGTASPGSAGFAVHLLLCGVCALCVLAGMAGLVRARLGDRRWVGVYLLGLTVLLNTLFLLSVLHNMALDTAGDTWWVPYAQRMGLLAAAGVIGTGVALC